MNFFEYSAELWECGRVCSKRQWNLMKMIQTNAWNCDVDLRFCIWHQTQPRNMPFKTMHAIFILRYMFVYVRMYAGMCVRYRAKRLLLCLSLPPFMFSSFSAPFQRGKYRFVVVLLSRNGGYSEFQLILSLFLSDLILLIMIIHMECVSHLPGLTERS